MTSEVLCQVAPPWLDREFMEKMLIKSECDESVRVQNVTGAPGTVNGDNYMSDIIRVTVEFTRNLSGQMIHHKSFIFKVEKEIESFRDNLSKVSGIFAMEIRMMTDTVVKMTEALNEKNVRFAARVYHTENSERSFIAMEDLGALGFRLADRKIGLDLQHCKLTIQRLAKFHASSVAVCEKNPDVADFYSHTVYNNIFPEVVKKIMNGAVASLAIESAKWEELDPSYSVKLSKLAEVACRKLFECTAVRKDDFNVINHGDCWVNNMLFRYNEKGEVVDQIFVDFQVVTYTSPALDLIYFLCTSAREDVRDHHYDEILEEYLKTLTSTMSRLGCETKPPTLESLRKILHERRFSEVVFSSLTLPFVLVDETEVLSIDSLIDPATKGETSAGYKSQRFRQKITKRLKEWDSLGLLDL